MAVDDWFGLSSPGDLLRKLRHDRERIHNDPCDACAAYDFFVTAWHMLDWQLPGNENKAARKAARESSPLLRVPREADGPLLFASCPCAVARSVALPRCCTEVTIGPRGATSG